MCIILVKPAGEKFPDKKILSKCFMNNPDGAGYMYRDYGDVIIRKGFMDLRSLMESVSFIDRDTGLIDRDVCIHFRLATHGKVTKGLTHPFPISNDPADLLSPVISCTAGIAHNGILYRFAPKGKGNISDTMVFIQEMVNNGIDQKKEFMMSHGSRQKFCLMTKDHIFIQGDFHYFNGIYYSNFSYQ